MTWNESAREALMHRRAAIIGRGLGATEAERVELGEIDAAIVRIDKGSYGHCEQCGTAIGRQRLRAVPEARRCLACS